MKIFKNYSVTNYSVIFGLAVAFLFFSACGKKENTDEIKLPFETKKVAKKVVKKLSPKKADGVLITAKLIS